jgi:lipopolysaccharide/colanic/teichoic acid biosynthesis glycosyltransferase
MKDSCRPMDFVMAGLGLVILAPLFLVVAVWVKLDSPGPVFYRARRVGRGGQEFTAFKFRSMKTGSDKAGPGITVSGDSRVTGSGRVLRRMKIDELPQLINVLLGEMALVGPRPEDPKYVAQYGVEQRELLLVRPGMTSPSSLRYCHEEEVLAGQDWETTYLERVLPDKLAVDHEYVRNRTIPKDMLLILRSVATMLTSA